MTLLLLLVGLGLIVLGADWLVDGASSIARKAGVSEFVIGLTIVGFGTSCPELVVSLTGALAGNADIAIGNVAGSNIFNVLFILGLTSLIQPVSMTATNRRRDIPLTLLVTVLFLLLGMSGNGIVRLEGLIFVSLFVAYIIWSFKGGKTEQADEAAQQRNLPVSVALVAAGLAGLIFGGDLFVKKATELARLLGVSDKFIAVTVLAGGTSLPELATSFVAALKGREQLALGNILGSNVFNILLIIGASSIITPLSFGSVTAIDAATLCVSMLLLLLWAYTGRRENVDRWEGALMLLVFGAYYCYLFNNI